MTTTAYKPEAELARLTKAVEVLSQEVSESPARDWFRPQQWQNLLTPLARVGEVLRNIHPCPDAKKRVLDAIDDEVRTARVEANAEAEAERETLGEDVVRKKLQALGLRPIFPPFPLLPPGERMSHPDREVVKWQSRVTSS